MRLLREEMGGGSQISFGSASTGRSCRRLKFCDSGVETPLLSTKTGENRGRRFYGYCGLFQVC